MSKDRIIELAIYAFLAAFFVPLGLMALTIVWALFISMVRSLV